MTKKILVVLAIAVAGFLTVVALRPADFRIARSQVIPVPPAVVFAQVNNFRAWEGWSPWAKLDPNAKNSFEGPASGVGSILRWAGNNKVGEGSMMMMESRPSDYIRIKLEFLKPFAATNQMEFTFKPEGRQTEVSWSMSGHNNFISKAMSLVMNCDKIIGGEFEKGLEQLKNVSEKK